MLRCLIASIFTIAAVAAHAESPPRFAVGLSDLRVGGTEESRSLNGHIWYPATGGGQTTRFGENAVWRGFEAYPNAPLANGRFPLVVISHGLFGNSFNQAWLATVLAESGFVVAAPNHPGTTTRDRDAKARALLWERPRDLGRTISALLEHPHFGKVIAADKISVIGHSLGGFDVMALAGARFDAARHRAYCAEHPERRDCAFVREAGIGGDPASIKFLETSLADRRISAVVSFDLGLTQALDPESLANVEVPVLVLGAGRDDDVLQIDAESRALVAALPGALVRYREPVAAGHYDFLGVCKPGAEAILKEAEPGDEIVCKAGAEKREVQHAIVVEYVKSFLRDVGLSRD